MPGPLEYTSTEWMKKAIEKADELNSKFQGPHELTDRHGWTARCCGNVDGCKWCALEALYSGKKGTQPTTL